MRESIGTVSLLNFVIFFILLVFSFLIGTFSYYKAYKVNNNMIAIIEKYEGFNELAYKEIEQNLETLAYQKVEFNCDNAKNARFHLINYNEKQEITSAQRKYTGYCVAVKTWDSNTSVKNSKDRYDSYQVTTVITFNFPIIQDVIKLRVSSRTNRIYNFECAQSDDCTKTCTNMASNGIDCMD